jgi:hypothetical protein
VHKPLEAAFLLTDSLYLRAGKKYHQGNPARPVKALIKQEIPEDFSEKLGIPGSTR